MKVRGVLISVDSNPGRVDVVEVEEDNLDEFYQVLNCSTIDIVTRFVGEKNKLFNFVCDDEGLLKDRPSVSAISTKGEVMLVGNLFVCNNYKEHLVSLSEDEIEYIKNHIVVSAIADMNNPSRTHVFPILIDVNFRKLDV